MTGLEYVNSILRKYAVQQGTAEQYQKFFHPYITEWANGLLVDFKISGSAKKGTAVSNGTDVDLFISLSSTTTNPLKELYDSLYEYIKGKGFNTRRQNVSIGVDYNSVQIDLVPAKRQGQYGNDHSLYVSKKNTWTKTNVDTHISQVSNSNRLNEIRLTKIWRNINNLDFPSFYLELIVIDALKNRTIGATDTNFLEALRFISQAIETRRYMDPANTNNCISDQISNAEKRKIALAASNSASKQYWRDIIS
jgi:hypothetical protein